jgi:uncharacterized protein (TIGR03118 family)
MGTPSQPERRARTLLALVAALAAVTAAALAASAPAAQRNAYVAHNLVSDEPGVADTTDPNLVNAWGLAATATSPWWVADAETDVSTIYNAAGVASSLVVTVEGGPTGLVANAGSNFVVSDGAGHSGPAVFIFATEAGTIRGWSPAVPPPPPSHEAQLAVDGSGEGAIYKGLAIASTPAGDRLYATDFHNARVDVFDGSFGLVEDPGAFVDPTIPDGFAPFGIQSIGNAIFVTYAKQDEEAEDDVAGQGLGFVDMFDTNGALLGRVATRGRLNAPWGLAMAPATFGRFSGDLLIGNFGDGEINAYEPQPDGSFENVGRLRGTGNKPISIDGLWSIQFGHGAPNNGPVDTLFFTAGPDDEEHGLFGTIRAG